MAPKGAKRGRSATDVTEAAGGQTTPATKGAKKAKAETPPKRDKDARIPRSETPRQPAPPTECRALKVLSLNVAGLRALLNGDKAATFKTLVEDETPDVLCLNETKLKPEDVEECQTKLKELLPKEYGAWHWSCSTVKKGYSGVAMILRQGVAALGDVASLATSQGMGTIGAEDPTITSEGRLLTLRLPEVSLISVYVPNSGQDLKRLGYRTEWEEKQCWDRCMAEYVTDLRSSTGKPVVVIGDLNCCQRVQDIWNMYERPDFPEGLAAKPVEDQYVGLSALKKFAGLTPEERASFPKMLAKGDLVDTFRALHPSAGGVFSYFSQRVIQNRPQNRGLRLDYVLATSDLCGHLVTSDKQPAEDKKEETLPRLHDSFILDERELVADHAPVGCQILLPKV